MKQKNERWEGIVTNILIGETTYFTTQKWLDWAIQYQKKTYSLSPLTQEILITAKEVLDDE